MCRNIAAIVFILGALAGCGRDCPGGIGGCGPAQENTYCGPDRVYKHGSCVPR